MFEVISPAAVRKLKAERPGNVEALLRMAVAHLEKVRGGMEWERRFFFSFIIGARRR